MTAAWLRGRGFDVAPIRHTPESFRLGQRELSSKEYYSFTSLLGMSLAAAQSSVGGRASASGDGAADRGDCPSTRGGMRLLLPSSVGSDADGQYVRAIRRACWTRMALRAWASPRRSSSGCRGEVADASGLFRALLAGDIAHAAALAMRGELVREACVAAEKWHA